MTKIWIITQLFYPEQTSTAYTMTRIAETLCDKNNVNVICSSSNYQSSNLRTNKSLNNKINIVRIYTPAFNKNNIFLRILSFGYFSISVLFKILLKIKNGDTIILVTNPPTILVVTAIIKKIKNFKLVVILHDIFPENAAISGIINKKSIIYKLSLKAMNFGYSKGDKLIACGSDMAQHFINKGIDSSKISVIPNWADEDLFETNFIVNRNEYFGLDLENKIVIEFAGNVGRVQGLERFLKIFKSTTNQKLILVIIGDGAIKKNLQDYVTKYNISNVFFTSSKPREEQKYFLNSCDIGLVTLTEGMTGLGVPSKIYNLMASSKPILYIGDTNSEISKYIKFNKIGWSFTWDKENEISEFLNNINNPKDFIDYGICARNFAINNFTEERILRIYKEHLS